MTIVVKNTVINKERFILADKGASGVRVWLADLPAPLRYITISTKTNTESEQILAEINEKMQKKA